MKYKLYLILVIIIFVLSSMIVTGDEIKVTSKVPDIKIIGGSTETIDIHIVWTGSSTVTATLSTVILPDDEGINVTYSENNITLSHNNQYTVQMTINTSLLLLPQPYIIQTVVTVHAKQYSSSSYSSVSDSSDTPDEIDNDTPDDTDEEPDDEKPHNSITIYIYPKLPIVPIALIIVCILGSLFYLLYTRKRGKK